MNKGKELQELARCERAGALLAAGLAAGIF